MIKKIVIGSLLVILLGALLVGAYDSARGASSLGLPQLSAASFSFNSGQGQGNGQGRGQGTGWGQGRGRGQGGQGQGQGQAAPLALIDHTWVTLKGMVVSFDQQGLMVDTAERGRLDLRLGPPGFASSQGVTFTAGETVTILGFDGDGGIFQAGEVTNDTTGTTLYLRDPNGRPLWAGRGQGQGGQGQGAQGR